MIKDALAVLDLMDAFSMAFADAKADGVINWMDIPKFAPVVGRVKAAVEGLSKIPVELEGATPDELTVVAKRAMDSIVTLAGVMLKK